ncbi:hypothetical protein Ahy_A04g018073 [Arachis hypogaea]|uniref:Uncharacterized protein n=1 Tax=Arachis hypogaea TaxID=3818 RepID=A0A445DCU6_ARAHY|nr:hypothetical protein Ahy_A04g018073 [Arachis hypogaea]
MARDQTRYRTPSPPPFANLENMEEDDNTPITRREQRILKLSCKSWKEKEKLWEARWKNITRRPALAFDKHIRSRVFLEGDLVVKIIMRKMSLPKWAPKWEAPYIVSEVHPNRHRILLDPDHGTTIGPINFKYVKQCYA